MGRLRAWLTTEVPQQLFAWLLTSYRRPVWLFWTAVVLPVVLLVAAMYAASTALWRGHALANLQVTARLAAEITRETLEETAALERLLGARPEFQTAVAAGDAAATVRHLEEVLALFPRVDEAFSPLLFARRAQRPRIVGC